MCSVGKMQFFQEKHVHASSPTSKNVFGCMGYIIAGGDNSSDLSAVAFTIMAPCCKNGDL